MLINKIVQLFDTNFVGKLAKLSLTSNFYYPSGELSRSFFTINNEWKIVFQYDKTGEVIFQEYYQRIKVGESWIARCYVDYKNNFNPIYYFFDETGQIWFKDEWDGHMLDRTYYQKKGGDKNEQ